MQEDNMKSTSSTKNYFNTNNISNKNSFNRSSSSFDMNKNKDLKFSLLNKCHSQSNIDLTNNTSKNQIDIQSKYILTNFIQRELPNVEKLIKGSCNFITKKTDMIVTTLKSEKGVDSEKQKKRLNFLHKEQLKDYKIMNMKIFNNRSNAKNYIYEHNFSDKYNQIKIRGEEGILKEITFDKNSKFDLDLEAATTDDMIESLQRYKDFHDDFIQNGEKTRKFSSIKKLKVMEENLKVINELIASSVTTKLKALKAVEKDKEMDTLKKKVCINYIN